MSENISVDVLIIGSGIAGAIAGAKLAQKGMKVAFLESGKRIDRFDAVEKFWNAKIKVPESAYPNDPTAPHPLAHRIGDYYQQMGPENFKSTYIKVVGGTTWHWLGTTLRNVPADFKMNSLYGQAVDWPFDYHALEPFYLAAEQEVGVAGDSTEDLGSPRSGDFPMPLIPQTYLDKQFTKALEGSKYQVRSTPQGRTSVAIGDRPECCGNGSCIPVCPVQAKYDATIHLDQAEGAGAVIYDQTTATRLNLAPDGQIASVDFRRADGSTGTAKGKVVVVAAHAIETPRLLLNSAQEGAANGVANSSDQVGRNLMDHPSKLSWAEAKDPVWPYRGPLSTSGIENLRDGEFRKDRAAFRIEIGNDGHNWPTGAPLSTAVELAKQGLRGAELDAAIRQVTSRHIRLASLVEQSPEASNRVTLDPEKRDANGMPLPRIEYNYDEYTRAGLAEAEKAHTEIFTALGATNINHAKDIQGSGHVIGTVRMGTDAASAVVDADLRSFNHRNLFLLGSGTFPTSATANPTLTIAALSLKAVPAIAATVKF
ncbi:GMC family oxidoreductase [Pseudochrobactrum algeriensis]|uniref:GMC family oxidoreductase n=1 Tax=Brucellaceae TaxID=118882 RepID=UPI000E257BD5|nr:GMC family oxidoreductase [Pseudochrobactrum algeriensis]MBX8814406.1 GMC family oxidoreductase [Ochrobactrum sp. MR34]QVQ36081.1 GMC family oxidoreductase [Pseudochrobactrum algeriensis]QVQ39298.1 GMC family oxidoreductase [Pseudochrobactrum algeriensis]QVQ43217.1 GMC family oxidoreductase [Pseudochrobactrum algeriensis]